jgi:hypothetical protein
VVAVEKKLRGCPYEVKLLFSLLPAFVEEVQVTTDTDVL